MDAGLFLPLSLFPAVLLSITHFSPQKSPSAASCPYVRADRLSKGAATPRRGTPGLYHWQGKGHKPDPAKFCQTTCHMLPDPSCQHSCNPVFIAHTTKQRMLLNLKVYVFGCFFFFSSSDSYFLVREEKKKICSPKSCF